MKTPVPPIALTVTVINGKTVVKLHGEREVCLTEGETYTLPLPLRIGFAAGPDAPDAVVPESPATEAWLAQRPGLADLRIYVAQGMQRDAFDQPAEFRGLLGDYVRQRSRELGAGDLNRLALLGEPLPPQVAVGRIGTAEFWTVAVDSVVRRTEEAAANTAGVVTP